MLFLFPVSSPGQAWLIALHSGFLWKYIFLKTIIPSRKATKMYKEELESQK